MPYDQNVRLLVPQEDCLAATSSSLDNIQQLHDSIPVPHAFEFPPLSDTPQAVPMPPADSPLPDVPKDADVAMSPSLSSSSTQPVKANPAAQAEESRAAESTSVGPVVGGVAAALLASLLGAAAVPVLL